MKEEPNYSRRELDHYFSEMKDNIKEILVDGKETKGQVFRTNGRVNKHDMYFRIMWIVLGGMWTILLMTLPSIIRFVAHINTLDEKVGALTENYQIKPNNNE